MAAAGSEHFSTLPPPGGVFLFQRSNRQGSRKVRHERGVDRFRTTNWSLVLSARGRATTESRRALSELCEAYWGPLYAYVRRQGYDVDDARDLTQGYFCILLDKDYLGDVDPEAGRFRWFLLASLKHFLSNERDRERAKKRGGGQIHVPFDTERAETLYRETLSDPLTADTLFERRWAATLLERTKTKLAAELAAAGKGRQFELLCGHLTGGADDLPLRRIAAELEVSDGAVRMMVHRMRQRFGGLLREEVARTVVEPAQVEDELRHLLRVVAAAARGGGPP